MRILSGTDKWMLKRGRIFPRTNRDHKINNDLGVAHVVDGIKKWQARGAPNEGQECETNANGNELISYLCLLCSRAF